MSLVAEETASSPVSASPVPVIEVNGTDAPLEIEVVGDASKPVADSPSPSPSSSPPEVVEVSVRAPPRRKQPGEMRFSAAEAARGAGTEGDPTKVVESLPGFARGGPRQSEPIAWGSAPSDTRVLIDGVEIPRLYHGSGIRSVVPTPFIESLSFSPGAFGVEYGRAVGGMLKLTTPSLDTGEKHYNIAVDTLDTSVYGSIPLHPTLAVAVAGRYGYADRWLKGLFPSKFESGLFDVPSYRDFQGAIDYFPSSGTEIRVHALSSHDDFSLSVPTSDPGTLRFSGRSLGFERLWATLRIRGEDGSETVVTPFIGHDTTTQNGGIGSRRFDLNTRSWRYGVRVSQRIGLSENMGLMLGVDSQGIVSNVYRYGSLSVPPREGDPQIFGLAPGGDVAVDDYRIHQVSLDPYIELMWKLGPVTVTPALRLSALMVDAERAYPERYGVPLQGATELYGSVEPRLSLSWQAIKTLTTNLVVGRYSQPPAVEDLGSVFGTPTLGPAHATHIMLSEQAKFFGVELESTAFYKRLEDLAVRSSSSWPSSAHLLDATGEGRSYGLSWLLRRRVGKYEGFFSATVSRSERTIAGVTRRSDYDQPWLLALAVSRALGDYSVGLRARYGSGMPRTPVVGRYYDTSIGGYQPVFGTYGAMRLPDFFQLDLRCDRHFTFENQTTLSVYLELLNVTFRKNAEELAYSADYSQRGYVTGMPPMIVVGARLER